MTERAPWTSDEFVERLRAVGQTSYHDRHPFHRLMNAGQLTPEQLRLWVANRFYYQKNIPIKDAYLLARCPVRDVRRRWIQRILDHDGSGADPGGIEQWLRLGEAIGVNRDQLENDALLLPAVRYAVDAYVHFVQTRPWVEGVASSLTELFAPPLLAERLAALERHNPWIDPKGLAYFRMRLSQAPRDSDHGLEVVQTYCTTRDEQERAVAALRFKCDLLWAQLDALYLNCVLAHQAQSQEGQEACSGRPSLRTPATAGTDSASNIK